LVGTYGYGVLAEVVARSQNPLIKGVLERNHDNIMVSGYRVLKSKLEVQSDCLG